MVRNLRTVLSLFDGISCGQIALVEEGFTFEKYYASEIDKNAINHTQLNFPSTIQLGDVERWREWDIDWSKVDLIMAGSPCQGFSTQGNGMAFDDPRSKLFWRFAEILEHVKSFNPDVKFLLENVRMKDEHMLTITKTVGLYPVMINSALVSAQERKRYYWSNIKVNNDRGILFTGIPQPKDRGLVVGDIVDLTASRRYAYLNEKLKNLPHKEVNGHYVYPTRFRTEGQINTLKGKAYTLTCSNGAEILRSFIDDDGVIHTFTIEELKKLQTVPDWYRFVGEYVPMANLLGNGWTIDVIRHILSFM